MKTYELKTFHPGGHDEQRRTVRVGQNPKFFDDLINKYIEAHQEEMMLLGQRPSRSGVVRKALYEFLKKEGIIQSLKIQEDTFTAHIIEVFRTLNSALEKSGVNCPQTPQEIERNVRKYIHGQAEKWGKKLTPQYVNELVKRVIELHSKTR